MHKRTQTAEQTNKKKRTKHGGARTHTLLSSCSLCLLTHSTLTVRAVSVFVSSPWGIIPPLMLLSAMFQINSAVRFQQSQQDLARNALQSAKKGAEVAKQQQTAQKKK